MPTTHQAVLHLAQSSSGQNPLLPNPTELVIGFVAFVIVFGVLAKMLLPRIQKTLAERTDAIEGGIQRAEEAQAEAQQVLEQYRAQLAEARRDASRLTQEAQEQGAAIIERMREEGQRQRESIVNAGHAQVTADIKAAQAALRQDIGRLAADLAGRIVGESLQDEARQSGIVDRFLDELEARADARDSERVAEAGESR